MATFRFELNGRPTKNKTYVVYLRVTVGGKRKLIKTMVEIARPSDFNAKCKGENWIRGGVRDAKVLNAQLADILAKAKETYKELDKEKLSFHTLRHMTRRARSRPSRLPRR